MIDLDWLVLCFFNLISRNGRKIHSHTDLFAFQLKDNKLNIDGIVEMGKMKFENDPAKMQLIRDIAGECAGVTDPDRCESAAKICKCIHDAATARNLMFEV